MMHAARGRLAMRVLLVAASLALAVSLAPVALAGPPEDPCQPLCVGPPEDPCQPMCVPGVDELLDGPPDEEPCRPHC